MVAAVIRDKIKSAVRAEGQTGALGRRLESQLPQLQNKLVLPDKDPVGGLILFIREYIESVPDCLQLVATVSRQMNFYDYVGPFLDMAEDYFLNPPKGLPVDDGLEALLDEAFLAHRLLEEVNDHHIRQLQRPLLPVDMTEANVIVHHLLGDSLASQLDQKVHDTAATLLDHEQLWARVRLLPTSSTPTAQLFKYTNLTWSARRIRLRLASEAS